MTNITNHPLYETARRAYYNTSFSPERRAEDAIASYEKTLAALPDWAVDKFKSLWLKHKQAESRCFSVMIVGGANFNNRRHDKVNACEHARCDELLAFLDKVKKQEYKDAHPELQPISSDNKDALALLRDKVAKCEAEQERVKEIKKILRSNTDNKLEQLQKLNLTEEEAVKLVDSLTKNFSEQDFALYSVTRITLTNNNAEIKRLQGRIKELESKQKLETKEIIKDGVRIVQNIEDNRLQLFFDGKPAQEMITKLKQNGYKWSPNNGCWQRQLTANAMLSLRHIFPKTES